ncbi:MAG: PDDEXK nuclease domain-containing protein [Bacteroidales bacterium]|nr:PDDEXK nuclease domain-containing protein [Bacteroidales bacterium]
MANEVVNIETRATQLADKIENLVIEARKKVTSVANTAQVYTYYEVGRYIIEDEQGGKVRAEYGKGVLKRVSERLTERLGKGWSEENLRLMRKFYTLYSNVRSSTNKIQASGLEIQSQKKQASGLEISKPTDNDKQWPLNRRFTLPWSHYLILTHVKDIDARSFYEIEAFKQQWSKRQLQRQIGSGLYERLALSHDKDEVMRLAMEGQVVEKPSDIIKDPVVLEFIGLKSDASYSETDLESAIINRLQDFLLEMGKGFLFEARQKRFTFEERHFYVDLVLYNRLLQCYVLVDLKMDDLTHQDLGQMQMYVNYYNRFVKEDFEKPTIGILLCERKNDALVELTLPHDANIYAQQYALCLPDKALLQQKLREWILEFRKEENV